MMSNRSILVLLLAALIGAALTTASNWSLEGAKLTVSSIDGSARISEAFTATKPPSVDSTFDINSDEVLRLAFTLQSSSGEKIKADELPHQVVVLMTDVEDPQRVTSSIVSIKPSSGKASWNQRMDRLHSTLTKGSGLVQVTLLIASFGDTETINLPLLRLALPTSVREANIALSAREKHELQQGFSRRDERRHTFNIPAADQMPPKIVSLVAAAITLALPSTVLVILVSLIMPSLSMRSPSTATLPFLASLCSLEVLALLYWIGGGFTLFKMMPWLLALGTINIFVGKTALGEMQRVRLGKQAV